MKKGDGYYSKVSFDAIDLCTDSIDDILSMLEQKGFGRLNSVDLANLLKQTTNTLFDK